MKFIVDEIPKSKSECPFSEWKPYPPIMKETGHYVCKINYKHCDLGETECNLLKAIVRCKDCKRRGNPLSCKLESEGMYPDPDWFCAEGERKDESN